MRLFRALPQDFFFLILASCLIILTSCLPRKWRQSCFDDFVIKKNIYGNQWWQTTYNQNDKTHEIQAYKAPLHFELFTFICFRRGPLQTNFLKQSLF